MPTSLLGSSYVSRCAIAEALLEEEEGGESGPRALFLKNPTDLSGGAAHERGARE